MDLETVDTDDLIEELQSRFDHSVFCGVKDVGGEVDASDVRWSGHRLTCSGLLSWANRLLMGSFARARQIKRGNHVD